jgi:hypothetical protein
VKRDQNACLPVCLPAYLPACLSACCTFQEEEEEALERREQIDMLNPVSEGNILDRLKMDQASAEERLMKDYLDNILPGDSLVWLGLRVQG